MKSNRIVLAGGTGFLGHLLAKRMAAQGWEVVVVGRTPQAVEGAARMLQWDGVSLGEWMRELDGAEAVVNLSGRSVNCRYTAPNRRLILDSRVLSTRLLGEAIAHCRQPPRVWLNASTATVYKHSLDRPMDETSEIAATPCAKDEFSVTVGRAWEEALVQANTPQTRKVPLRMAMVLSPRPGTVFRVLRRLVRLGLGGSMAGGQQYVSWIHEDDFCRALVWLIEHDDLSGGVNVAAPNPLPNGEVMRTLRRVCGAPFGLPASRAMLEVGAFFMRTETELMIKSRRAVPGRLLQSGFVFEYAHFEEAVKDLEAKIAKG